MSGPAVVFVSVYSRRWGPREELGVAYVAGAAIEAGFRATVLLVVADGDSTGRSELERLVGRSQPILVGIGCSHSSTNLSVYRGLAQWIRRAHPEAHITCGGYAATFSAGRFLENWPELDSVVVGEGERTIVDMLRALVEGRRVDECRGVLTRRNELKPRAAEAALDTLPEPYRDAIGLPPSNLVPISTSRGCLAHCTFCNVPRWTSDYGAGWRGRSPQSVVREMARLQRERGARRFWIVDSSYEDPFPRGFVRIGAIADGLIEARLAVSYYAFFRAESVLDPEFSVLLPRLVESGLRRVFIGVESGTSRELKGFGKNATLDEIHRALRLFDEHDVPVRHGFIMFGPKSSFASLRENLSFMKRAGFLASTADLMTRLELYAGAAEVKKLEREGLLSGDPWNDDFAYRFLDSRIERLARSLSALRAASSPDRQWEAPHTAKLVSRSATRSREVAARPELYSLAVAFREEVDEIWQLLAESNEAFFEALLELAECGWDEGEFQELVRAHVDGIHCQASLACGELTREFLLQAARQAVDVVF